MAVIFYPFNALWLKRKIWNLALIRFLFKSHNSVGIPWHAPARKPSNQIDTQNTLIYPLRINWTLTD
jgi:hypothetical protein